MKQHFLKYLLAVITLLASCTNPFTTRADQVEKPDIGDIEYADYNMPENILTNLILAIEKRDLPGYMNCFSADAARFKFDYEPHFYDAFQAREWTLDDEEDFFNQLKVNTISLGFSFTAGSAPALNPIHATSPDDSVESALTKYRMDITDTDSTRIYEGFVRFKLFHDQEKQRWHIYYWQDRAEDDKFDITITALKTSYN